MLQSPEKICNFLGKSLLVTNHIDTIRLSRRPDFSQVRKNKRILSGSRGENIDLTKIM